MAGKNLDELLIKKVAIVNGAGSSYWRKAKKMGADLLITGDVKYHEALDYGRGILYYRYRAL